MSIQKVNRQNTAYRVTFRITFDITVEVEGKNDTEVMNKAYAEVKEEFNASTFYGNEPTYATVEIEEV